MKNKINIICYLFLLLQLMFIFCQCQINQAEQLVFLLAGQSNMAGRAIISELPQAATELLTRPQNIILFERWPIKNMYGPEISLMHEISALRKESNCIFIKYAIGSSSLYAWDPEWQLENAQLTENEKIGPLYQDFIRYIQLITKSKNVRFEAVFWMQGERDARYHHAGMLYRKNIEKLIKQIRYDLGTSDLPFILGQISPPQSQYPAVELVRRAQTDAAQTIKRLKLIPTDDLGKKKDQIHFNFSGQIELGKRFAKAYSEFLD